MNKFNITKRLSENGKKFTALEKGTKEPFIKNWYGNPVQPEYFEQHSDCNVAVLTGEASGNLIDIDLDDPMAVDLAEYFLPETGLTWGRTTNPRSHWLYRTTEASGVNIYYICQNGHKNSVRASTIYARSIQAKCFECGH